MLAALALACSPGETRRSAPDSRDTAQTAGDDTARDDPDSGTDETGTDETGTDVCAPLAPSSDPSANRANLTACLAEGAVDLGGGTFEIDQGITLPVGARLTGSGTLRLVASSTNHVLMVTGDNVVNGVRLDGNGLVQDANGSVLHVTGSGSTLSQLWIGDSTGGSSTEHIAGVYFIDDASTDNVLSGSEITGTFYGVIFVAGLEASEVNTVSSTTIHETWCDGVTFAGYGELTDSTLSHSGADCDNGPIPGASVYGLDNDAGARIARNTMSDDCGNVIDLDHVANFVIEDNVVEGPGYQWEGWAPWCGGGAAIAIIDSSSLTITGNVAENDDRPQNRLDVGGDPNGIFGGDYADAPAGGATIVAFWLAERPANAGLVTGSTISGNEFRAACGSGCSGLGYYTSRGTGYDASGGWNASTTNYFTANDPYGSNVGSRRCGGNWYAANSSCAESASDADCNTDDWQHDGDWARNDGCY